MAERDLAVVIELIHREVNNPAKLKYVGVDQAEALAEFVADVSTDFAGGLFIIGNEEHDIAVAHAAELFERVERFLGEKFCNRALNFAFVPAQVAEAFGTDGLCKLDHVVEKLTRLARAAFHRDGLDGAA